jgi:hypothetical protein
MRNGQNPQSSRVSSFKTFEKIKKGGGGAVAGPLKFVRTSHYRLQATGCTYTTGRCLGRSNDRLFERRAELRYRLSARGDCSLSSSNIRLRARLPV